MLRPLVELELELDPELAPYMRASNAWQASNERTRHGRSAKKTHAQKLRELLKKILGKITEKAGKGRKSAG